MLRITINVNAPPEAAQSIKENLAMYLERWGDSRVVDVRSISFKELAIEQQRGVIR